MRKLFTLVAMLALGISGAWADDTYSSVYTRTVSNWTTDDVTAWGGNSLLAVDATNGLGFTARTPSSAYSATKSFTILDNAKVKYEVTWYAANNTGNSANYEYIQFGDKVRISWNYDYYYYVNVDGTSSKTNKLNYDKTAGAKTISIIFNTATKTVESFNFNGTDLKSYVTGTLEGNFNSVTFGLQRGGSTPKNWDIYNYLTSISVSQAEQTVTAANYTINYKNGETTVKTVSSSSTVGATITAARVVTGDDNVKYLTTAATLPSMTLVDGTNTLDVPVHTPITATLTVTTTVGDDDATTATTTLTEADDLSCNWSYAFPLYKTNAAGVYYKTNATTFGESGTFTSGQTIEKTVTYDTEASDVVYFCDASTTAGTNYTYSNGESGYVAAQNARDRGLWNGTLSSGKYKFIVKTTAKNGRYLVLRSGTSDPFASIYQSKTEEAGEKSVAFIAPQQIDNIYINGANSGTSKTNQSEDFDYAMIVRTGNIPVDEYTKTLGTTGFGTFSATYNVTVPSGVTVYNSSYADDTFTATTPETKVSVIPANTGVIFKGTPNTEYTFNTTTNAAVNPVTTALTAAPEGVTGDGSTIFGLLKNENTFALVNSTVTLANNSAYLVVSEGSAKAVNFVIEDDAPTAVNAVKSATVAPSVKKYVKNGNLVIETAKGTFSAAGARVK